MARPVRTAIEEVAGLDEEFHTQLERGAAALARGDAEVARESLTRAAELRRDDATALGLLGQALYRLGKFDEAAALFGKLVEQNPLEAGAQVNLGLANLRAKRYVEAISHLERALDLNPEHRKAMGYLGLAWLEHGNVARAREWFSRAGSEHMVARCDELLQAARRSASPASEPQWTVATPAQAARVIDGAKAVEQPSRSPADDEAEIASAVSALGEATPAREPPAAVSAVSPAPVDDATPSRGPSGWKLAPISVVGPPARCIEPPPETSSEEPRAPEGALSETAAAEEPVQAQPVQALAPAPAEGDEAGAQTAAVPAVPETPAAPAALRRATLDDLPSCRIPAVDPPGAPTFALAGDVLRVAVRGQVLTRVSGKVAERGSIEMMPEMRRYRGRGTDKLFGAGRDPVHRVAGAGALFIRTRGLRHSILELGGAAALFREDCVFAMEASIAFDHARLTARAGPDVDLVQLRGEGAFVLVTRGDLVAVDVSEVPLRVAVSALVGWTGALTPRLTTLAEGASGDSRAIEISGEGRVLLDSGTGDG